MWLEGLKGGVFLPFPYKVSEVPRNKRPLIMYCPVHGGHGEPTQWIWNIIQSKMENQCGKYFLKASKKATVHKAKPLYYSHIDGHTIKVRLEESKIPSKPKWPLRTSWSTVLNNSEKRLILATCILLQYLRRKFNQRLRELVTTQGIALHRH